MLIDLKTLPPYVRDILAAAQKVDRDNLDNVEVHPCDTFDDGARRKQLFDARRELSEALANAQMTVAPENVS